MIRLDYVYMKHFFNPFHRSVCPKCGKRYDPLSSSCPKCHEKNEEVDPRARSFAPLLTLGAYREIGLFLIGFVGLFLLAQVIGIITLSAESFRYAQMGLTGDELKAALTEFSSSVRFTLLINDLTYTLIFAAMLLFLWKDNKRLLKSFANLKILFGFVVGFAMIILSGIWSNIAIKLGASTNINQGAVEETIKASPLLAVLVTGLIAPFVEELTYRVGAFTFLKRINTVLAYVVVGALFGLIHIKDYGSLNEWLSYPSYLIAGLCLCFAYDKFGFGGSFLAHAMNNLLAVLSYILTSGK